MHFNQVVDRAGSRITMGRHSVYKGRDSTLAGGVVLKEGVLVSSGSKVVFSTENYLMCDQASVNVHLHQALLC